MTTETKTQKSEQIRQDTARFQQKGGVIQQQPQGATGMDPLSGKPISKRSNRGYFNINPGE